MENFALLSDRIKYLMRVRNIGISDLARAGGVKPSSATAWINGVSKNFRAEVALELSKNLDVSLDWLVTGKGIPEQEDVVALSDREDDNEHAFIKEYEIKFACGDGFTPTYEEITSSIPAAYRRSWFASKGVKPENCKRFKIYGCSMEPLLYDGDTVMVDLSDTEVRANRVYALIINDELKVKRLVPLLKGGLVVKSDNPEVKDEEFSKDDTTDYIKILGKVIDRSGDGGL